MKKLFFITIFLISNSLIFCSDIVVPKPVRPNTGLEYLFEIITIPEEVTDLAEKVYKIFEEKKFYKLESSSNNEDKEKLINEFSGYIIDLNEFQIIFVGNEKAANIIVLNQFSYIRKNQDPRIFLHLIVIQTYKQYINLCKKSCCID